MKPRVKATRQSPERSYDALGGGVEEITLAEQVYRALRRDLISGEIEPGQSLRLEFLKQRYGISFSPIREALNRLQSERMVVSTASRGFRVAPFSREEMWDAAETRILIDCEAMRRSLKNGDDAWETRLVAAYHALNLAAKRVQGMPEPDAEASELLEQRHLDFHQALIGACGSRWLTELSMQMYTQTERYRRPTLRGRSGWGDIDRDVGREHQELMDAALARDSERAVRLLAEHYRTTVALIERFASFNDEPSHEPQDA
ncbi:GntR family transcriptional regulator [Pigmentiphaga sp.]|uniref:GntR family transcriptional regulator n=1 Tax=Pigmentiphaga sp. TaxID=1977564 RepID=UPI0025EE3AC7|nr:FCD domain-containing protein [Pigmentiphaga sp.]MBX6316963.1 FCD domain-containing protein [Pigmentiphaga sp.]